MFAFKLRNLTRRTSKKRRLKYGKYQGFLIKIPEGDKYE